MTTRILINEEGDALLVEPGSYMLYEPEFPILTPTSRMIRVVPRRIFDPVSGARVVKVPPRGGG